MRGIFNYSIEIGTLLFIKDISSRKDMNFHIFSNHFLADLGMLTMMIMMNCSCGIFDR